MKICIISTQSGVPWGGSESLWVATAHAALDEYYEVAIAFKRWPQTPAPILELQARGARLFLRSVNLERRSSRIYERLVHPLPALVRWRPDVVLVNQSCFYDTMYRNDINRLLRAFGVPYVVISHQNQESQCVILDDATRRKATMYFRAAHRVGFVSERNRWSAECQLMADLPNSCIVRNPVNLCGYNPVPWPDSSIPRLACVARLDVNDKGQDVLFAALAVESWRSRPWMLRLYGDGRHRTYMVDLAKHFSLSDRMEFRGHFADIRSIWADNHMLLLPSRCEGTPIALVEAMICGRPAVVTDIGGNAEWITEPRSGFVAEAPSMRSYGAALERAWAARDTWQEMGANAHHDAMALLDREPGRTVLRMLTEAVGCDYHGPVGV